MKKTRISSTLLSLLFLFPVFLSNAVIRKIAIPEVTVRDAETNYFKIENHRYNGIYFAHISAEGNEKGILKIAFK
jgi:hypothetical protein